MSEIYNENVEETNKLDENSNRYRRVKKALFGDPSGKIKTFAIISPENPLGIKGSDDQELKDRFLKWSDNKSAYNKEKTDELKTELIKDRIKKTGDDALKYGHHTYVQLRGKYGEYENSFLILNLTLDDAKTIARDYGQESFFWGVVSDKENTPSVIGYYLTNNFGKTYRLVEVTNTIYDVSDAEDFFSKYGFKYRIGMREFGDDVPEVKDTKEFEESFDDNGTYASRALHRRNAYRDSVIENKSTRLKSALFDRTHKVRTFAIITAENPGGEQKTPEENKKLRKKFNDELKEFNLQYIKIRGRYKDTIGNGSLDENSVMIINLTLNEALYFAEEYGQESFFFGNDAGISYYEMGSNGKYEKVETTKRIENKEDADNFFSRFRNFKFSIYLDAFNKESTEINLEELDKSLDENRTLKSRIIHRRKSRK